jgi:hypothetical protein
MVMVMVRVEEARGDVAYVEASWRQDRSPTSG